jgi:hypothetical protein
VRNSDRLATPAVVITLLLVGMVLVGGTVASVTYLTARGIDPEPVFKLAGLAVTACASLGGFVLQLVNRTTIAKTEQQAGLANAAVQQQASHLQTLTSAVYDVSDALPRPVRSSYEDTLLQRTAPAPPGR